MNKYFSYTRTFRGRRLVEKAIAPPAVLAVGLTDWNPVIFNRSYNIMAYTGVTTWLCPPMNLNSNILLKRVGVFCNFADGLVSKKVSVGLGTGGFNGLDINIRASAYSRSLIAGTTITGTTASRTLTVAGPGVGLAAGAVLLLTSGINQFFAPVYEYVMVESFAAPNLVLYDYPKYNYVAFPLYLLNFIAESYFYHSVDINELNYMYEADNYFTPNQFSTAAATDIVIFGQAIPNGTVEYFTKSIDTSYLNDIALFDMLAEIEFTKSSQIITTP